MRIYDTKSRAKIEFEPVRQGSVGIYVCGPTVYNYIHIGNARTFISFDIIRRYFMWRGFEVTFVQNITDVDDKIIVKANEEGRTAEEVSVEYTKAFIEDMHKAGVLDPDIRPKATEEITSMIELIEELISGGNAYEEKGDVYFSVRSFSDYGALSGRDVEDMESGHRSLVADGLGTEGLKHAEEDFALWKSAKPGEPSWDSPWGPGRPGWHIECSAMARKYLGLPFDIHGGGADLVFPHHENERAQSEAACGCTFANYWMHGGMLQINAEKMSKSLGNFMLLRDVLETTDVSVLRMLMIQTHYRSPLDFSQERLDEAATALGRITNTVKNLRWACQNAGSSDEDFDAEMLQQSVCRMREGFIAAMDDDLNTAEALGAIFTALPELNGYVTNKTLDESSVRLVEKAIGTIEELMGVFGIVVQEKEEGSLPRELVEHAQRLADFSGVDPSEAAEALLTCRAKARANKDWGTADNVRDCFAALGLIIEDTPQGARISRG